MTTKNTNLSCALLCFDLHAKYSIVNLFTGSVGIIVTYALTQADFRFPIVKV
jgi:hypothetical protein